MQLMYGNDPKAYRRHRQNEIKKGSVKSLTEYICFSFAPIFVGMAAIVLCCYVPGLRSYDMEPQAIENTNTFSNQGKNVDGNTGVELEMIDVKLNR